MKINVYRWPEAAIFEVLRTISFDRAPKLVTDWGHECWLRDRKPKM